jgi:hypothetical protein
LKHEVTEQRVQIEIHKHHGAAVATETIIPAESCAAHSAGEHATPGALLLCDRIQSNLRHGYFHRAYREWDLRYLIPRTTQAIADEVMA